MLKICLFALLVIWAIDSLQKSALKKDYEKERKLRASILRKQEKRDTSKRKTIYDWNKENILFLNKYPEYEEFDPSKIYEFETDSHQQQDIEYTIKPHYTELYCKETCASVYNIDKEYEEKVIFFKDVERSYN